MAPNSFKSSLCAQHLMWEGLGKAFCERTGRFLYLSFVCACACTSVCVRVWTMTVSAVPEELMSRWSEWDSAYSLSLLFTLALARLCSCSRACLLYVFVSLSQALSLAPTCFFFPPVSSQIAASLQIVVTSAACQRKVVHGVQNCSQNCHKTLKRHPAAQPTCNMGVLTPACEGMFEVALNK